MATVTGIWEASRALCTKASIASPKREVGQARAGRYTPSLRNVATHLPSPACWLPLLQGREPVSPPNMSPVKRYELLGLPAFTFVLTFMAFPPDININPSPKQTHLQEHGSVSARSCYRTFYSVSVMMIGDERPHNAHTTPKELQLSWVVVPLGA
jgi:hypothetical protein